MGDERLYSSAETAEALGITQRRVQQMARARGVGREVGGSLVFTVVDIATLRQRPSVGRPRQGLSDFAARQLAGLYHEQKRLGAGDPVSQASRASELATYYRQAGNEPEATSWQAVADQHAQSTETRLVAERAAQLLPVIVRVYAPDGGLVGEEISTARACASVPVHTLINAHQRTLGNHRELTGSPGDGIYLRGISFGVWGYSPWNPAPPLKGYTDNPYYRVEFTNPDGTPHGI